MTQVNVSLLSWVLGHDTIIIVAFSCLQLILPMATTVDNLPNSVGVALHRSDYNRITINQEFMMSGANTAPEDNIVGSQMKIMYLPSDEKAGLALMIV